MVRVAWCLVPVISLVFLLLYPAVTRADVPSSYITENVQVTYAADGSVLQPAERLGYVEVEVPNNQDVLQYIMLDLSGTADTNLQSVMAYKGVAASPNPGSRTRIYLNTTASQSNISYEVTNTGITPVIYIDISYSNSAGGQDMFSGGTNTFLFNVTMNSTQVLSGVTMTLMFSRNLAGPADSFHLYGAGSNSGSALVQDTDSDGYFDSAQWLGNLGSGDVEVWFMGDTTPGANFNEASMSVDLDQGTTSQAQYQDNTQTFTGITFSNRFSRGPIREGVVISDMGNWAARGFIRNMATGLDYTIHGWELYKLGESTSVMNSTSEIGLYPGSTEYTEWYDTGVPRTQDKSGYFSTSWDWEIGWGSSSYTSASLATLVLPVLYEIDVWPDKSVAVGSNSEAGVSMSVQDRARHLGHSSLQVGHVNINSTLPRVSSGGASNSWNPSGIRVIYVNGSGQLDITSQTNITSQAAGATDGYVNVDIADVAAVIGSGLGQNQDVLLEYSVSGGSHTTTQVYQFCQSSTLFTLSGTPVTENACEDVTIPGVGGPGPGPGPGGGGGEFIPPALHAEIIRDMGEGYFVADNLVHVIASYSILDTGTNGVKDVKAMLYIPEHGNLDASSLEFRIFDSSEGRWLEWIQGTDYTLTDNGITSLDGRPYREYIISKISSGNIFEEGLTLFDSDRIEIGYFTTIPVGTSYIVTRVSGYNHYDDQYMFEDLYIPIRREGTLQDLVVSEGTWQTEKIYVGKPVTWIRSLEVYNPNNVSVESVVSLAVFPDSLEARIISQEGASESLRLKDSNGIYVDVVFRLGPGETGMYVLEATTPPVLETGRVVDVIESSETEIKFMVNITLENFALENYPGVSLLFRATPERVIEVTEGGTPLNFSEFDEQTTEIFLGEMRAGQKRELSLVYSEVPPILLTSMSSFRYTCASEALMTVFVVPSERETTSYLEIEVVGPYPELKTVNAQLIELRDLWPWEEVEIPVRLDISNLPDGSYRIYTGFKKNFVTVLYDSTDFMVDCPSRLAISVSWIGFLVVAVALIIYSIIRLVRKRRAGELDDVRKRLREFR